MTYSTQPDVVRLLAEWFDTKSDVKLGGFRPQLQASYVSSHTEELWYNKTDSLWMTIYIYMVFTKIHFKAPNIVLLLPK